MIIKTPTTHHYSFGHAEGITKLNSFDNALMDAGVGNTNLIRMSSIVPPHSKQVYSINLPHGALVPIAYAAITSSTPGENIAAGVACAYPEDPDHAALIMEYSAVGSADAIERQVRKMALTGMQEYRGMKVREVRSVAVEHKVLETGTAFACIVLWDEE